MPPFAFVTPVPLSVPPDQVSRPDMVNAPAPVIVPALCSSVVMELVAFKVKVPKLTLRSAANVAAPVILNGPVVKAIGAPVFKLAMV